MPETSADHERRIADLEEQQKEFAKRMVHFENELAKNTQELAKNTETTNSIKADTSKIVALFQASELGATIVKWCATVGGGIIVAYAAMKGLTGR